MGMRVLIADDHRLLAGLRQALQLDDSFEIVAEVGHGTEILALVRQTQPEVVLLDMRMPGADGLACLDRLRAHYPEVPVVMCSMSADPEHIQSAFRHGASGYIVKTINPLDLGPAIRLAVEGTAWHAHGLPAINEGTVARAAGLTERESDIVQAVARGLDNQAIAQELWITEQTIAFDLTNVHRKLGVSDRTEVVRWTLSRGLHDAQTVRDELAGALEPRRAPGLRLVGRSAGS
jgi:DNA-binding NarL/FixJ family response regulator